VRQARPSDGSTAFLLALLSTLVGPADQSVHTYGQRWNIETDLVDMGLRPANGDENRCEALGGRA